MMEQGVGVVEDGPFVDGVVLVMRAELGQGPVRDVLAAVAAILVVGVEGEALGFFEYVKTRNHSSHQGLKRFVTSDAADTNHSIFSFSLRYGDDGGEHAHPIIHQSVKVEV